MQVTPIRRELRHPRDSHLRNCLPKQHHRESKKHLSIVQDCKAVSIRQIRDISRTHYSPYRRDTDPYCVWREEAHHLVQALIFEIPDPGIAQPFFEQTRDLYKYLAQCG